MKKKRFSIEQITVVLQQAEQGCPSGTCVGRSASAAELLPLEEGVRRAAAERSAGTEAIARGKHDAEAAPGGRVAQQGHATGHRPKEW